jgi:hypothetical protein
MAVTLAETSARPLGTKYSLGKLALHSLLIVSLLASGGCVVGRRTIDLEVPTAAKIVDSSKGTVSIVAIVDKRRFENKPSEPSTPSIDGDVASLTPASQSKMIGRQRNGYGKAMGDIALVDGQSIENKMRLMVAEAFKRRGYAVTDSRATNNTEIVIDKFWAWFTPGFWAVDFEADIRADMKVALNGRNGKFTVTGHGKNTGQVASDANWQLAYSRAFEDFIKNLEAILKSMEEDVS